MKNIWAPFSLIFFSALLWSGCAKQNVQSDPAVAASLRAELQAALKNNASLVEVKGIGPALPEGIDRGQIKKYFSLGKLRLALVLRPSQNIPLLEVRKRSVDPAVLHFGGVLIARESDERWTKLLQIQDIHPEESGKNNPYYLWSNKNTLFLSIVDHNGAGSGEGIMKVFRLGAEPDWKLTGCYYFVDNETDPNGDYFAFSKNLSKLQRMKMKYCEGYVTLLPE